MFPQSGNWTGRSAFMCVCERVRAYRVQGRLYRSLFIRETVMTGVGRCCFAQAPQQPHPQPGWAASHRLWCGPECWAGLGQLLPPTPWPHWALVRILRSLLMRLGQSAGKIWQDYLICPFSCRGVSTASVMGLRFPYHFFTVFFSRSIEACRAYSGQEKQHKIVYAQYGGKMDRG